MYVVKVCVVHVSAVFLCNEWQSVFLCYYSQWMSMEKHELKPCVCVCVSSDRAVQPDQVQSSGLHVRLEPHQIQHHQQDPTHHAQLLRDQQRQTPRLTALLGENHHRPEGQRSHTQCHGEGHTGEMSTSVTNT